MDRTRIQLNIVDSADLLRHVTADKARLYRSIMDVFAAAKRQYRLQLRPDEVANEAEWPENAPRTEEINALLAQLSQWGNLESQPDTARVSSLSDFYRARFLYRLSHGGEAVETGIATLLQTLRRRAELQTVALEDIAGRLLALKQLIEADTDGKGPDAAKAHETLRDLVRVFEDLAENAQSFMAGVAPPMRPARFYLAHEIPHLPSSKLDVRALVVLDDANVRRESDRRADEANLAPMVGDRIAQMVARVWQDVLLAPVSGPDDDFFGADGDSLKAITFAMELERALGVELSPTLIYEAPRFGAFCQMLRECRAPRYDALVPLKAGAGLPPVFFIHGVGGNVVAILPTARRMAYPGAVIGIRARGFARGEAPHSSVEAMAADYLREIKARQPHGPYYLCGYSFGGLVAVEIARRLLESPCVRVVVASKRSSKIVRERGQ